jgi:hypothetical protein
MLNALSKIITEDDNAFPLKGMINPCFQNNGNTTVVILGNELAPGDSFPMMTNGEELANSVNITFGTGTTKKLICNYFTRNKC